MRYLLLMISGVGLTAIEGLLLAQDGRPPMKMEATPKDGKIQYYLPTQIMHGTGGVMLAMLRPRQVQTI